MAAKNESESFEARELAHAIRKFAHTKVVEPAFATYTNGERRSELKTISKAQQSAVVTSVAHALDVKTK